jgi:hypothetical protein
MFTPEQYKRIGLIETTGHRGGLGVQIHVAGLELTPEENSLVRAECERVHSKIQAMRTANDPEDRQIGDKIVADLLQCFGMPIYGERIPNGYCSQSCCTNRPWLRVFTTKGPIIIGWRKRVISIDWSKSDVEATAEQLFPLEETTKWEQLIHAWGYEKAKQYLQTIADQPTKGVTRGVEQLLDPVEDAQR